MKILAIILLVLLLFIFPQELYSPETETIEIFFYEVSEQGEDVLSSYILTIPYWLNTQQRAFIVFNEIFNNFDPEKMIYVPPDVQVLDVFFHPYDAHLILNVSSEILNYGGTHFEDRLVTKLIKNAGNIPGVGYFTVLIDGQREYLPEGIMIHEFKVY